MACSIMKSVRFVTPLKKLHHKSTDDRKSLQQTSVNLVVVEALNALQIIKNTTTPSNIDVEAIPHFLFRWTEEQHRSIQSFNNVWYQMLLKHYDDESVTTEKFQIDINELTTFMLLILNNYIDNCDPNETQSLLDEAVKYINYYEKYNKDMKDYKNTMYAKQAIDFLTLLRKASKKKPLNPNEQKMDDIQMRARLKCEDSGRDQMELRLGLAERELIDKISQEKNFLKNENKCYPPTMNAYYGYQDV
uniref:Uncharacterized protein n=1 Tax=Glossina austeni TaxID=7395 RepID=A0A1A9VUL3_GLOAU